VLQRAFDPRRRRRRDELRATRRSRGRCGTAAAGAHDACLYTRNVDDLAGLDGLVEVVVV